MAVVGDGEPFSTAATSLNDGHEDWVECRARGLKIRVGSATLRGFVPVYFGDMWSEIVGGDKERDPPLQNDLYPQYGAGAELEIILVASRTLPLEY